MKSEWLVVGLDIEFGTINEEIKYNFKIFR